ncbi:MAG: IS3 family transposase, partial [Acidobacteriota bacterium]
METTLTRPEQIVNGTPEKPKRRRFSAEFKLRILEEAERCTKPGELGLLLRREGLYSSHLAEWRRWRRRRYPEHPQSRKPATESQLKHENAQLQRQNARLRMKLDHAEKLVALQKKFTEMLE